MKKDRHRKSAGFIRKIARVFGSALFLVALTGFMIVTACLGAASGVNRPTAVRSAVHSEPIYLSPGSAVDVASVVSVTIDDQKEVHYVVRKKDGTVSDTLSVVDGKLVAKKEDDGILYVYADGTPIGEGVPVHALSGRMPMEEVLAVSHPEYKPAVITETKAVTQDTEGGSLSEEEKELLAFAESKPGTVVFLHNAGGNNGLTQNLVSNFYSGKGAGREGFVFASEMHYINIVSQDVLIEKEGITAWLGQEGALLPRIWYLSSRGERRVLYPEEFTWETSDDGVVSVASGIPEIAGSGEAELKGTCDLGSFTVRVNVIEPDAVDDFKTISDDLYALDFSSEEKCFEAKDTILWPSVLPSDTGKEAVIKGERVYQCCSQYYYLEKDVKTDWDKDLLLNAESIGGMIPLSQGMVLMEGDTLDGIVRGVIYREGDDFWVYDGNGEDIQSPAEEREVDL